MYKVIKSLYSLLLLLKTLILLKEAAKKSFFSGPATKGQMVESDLLKVYLATGEERERQIQEQQCC